MSKIDMTPTGVDWIKDGSFSLRDLMDIPLLEVAEVINSLIEEHGPTAKLEHDRGTSIVRVMAYKPTYNTAQTRQMLTEFAKEYDRKSAENVRARYAAMLAKKNKK
jgi:hypothetical protein